MRLKLGKAWLAVLLGSSSILGCERSSIRPNPQDPLLISKKPIESKAVEGKPTALAYTEPAAPSFPETALASAPPDGTPFVRAGGERGGRRSELVTFGKPVPATPRTPIFPAVRGPGEVPAVTVQRRQPSGPYDHASDYSWLQGTLDRHFHGHFSLRYCDATAEDRWGGKMHLEDDPRLAQFKEGDIVMVDGEIVRENGQVVLGACKHYPRYRIRNVKLVQRQSP